jgi:alpha-L-rhamnosidase
MHITHMKTNRIVNPLGFQLDVPRVSWVTEGTEARSQAAAQVQVAADEGFERILFDSGKREDIDSLAYELPVALAPCTRYYWRVTVWADNGEIATSEPAWFETAKLDQPWQAIWITPTDQQIHPLLRKAFSLPAPVVSARISISGLGLYELAINGRRVGNEYLTPYCNAYDQWIQYQTFDVTDLLQQGDNVLGAMLGNGWYKGRFGFEGVRDGIYGQQFALLCELVVECTDGQSIVVGSDTSWKTTASPVLSSSIYDGEEYDANREQAGWSSVGFDDSAWEAVQPIEIGFERLQARRSLPVVIKETLKPVELIHTPAGETVLDMGQNMVGWLSFQVHAPRGTEIHLQYGEVLQQGNFYRDNLRSAKEEYRYISNGGPAFVQPYFTFYGFRYVKISGWPGEIDPNDFTGCIIYSDMEQTGQIETSNPLVNRLILNALWGQKGNFVDVPTDCPQRDERMGWTGDAQVFSGTACFNMDVAAFFSKYLYDMYREQQTRDGMVPMVVPSVGMKGGGSAAWGDAAAIIPWNVYLHYGDKAILAQQFESMKAWVNFIKAADDASGGQRLWTVGFHFGDWLALDGDNPLSRFGGTAIEFIASAYYYYSASLVAKAASVLGKEEEVREYEQLAGEVRKAIQQEFITPRGRVAVNTQTALVLTLFLDLAPEQLRERVAEALRERLRASNNHLKTGFVGTPYLCRVLSNNDSNDLAYRLLLNDDYPGWLYAVKMGATTIWERWNSILPDGSISDTGMNSLNHYAYGSIVEWMYRDMLGLNPVEERPGFRHTRLTPQPDGRIKWAKASFDSAAGRYESSWSIGDDGRLSFQFRIPFNATATLTLPDADLTTVNVNGQALTTSGLQATQQDKQVTVEIAAGQWSFDYQPTRDYIQHYTTSTPLSELLKNSKVMDALSQVFPELSRIDGPMLEQMSNSSLRDIADSPFMDGRHIDLARIDEELKTITVE